MYGIQEIVVMNHRVQSEVAPVRHCSYQASRRGIVLHSANQRATVFLQGSQAQAFKRKACRLGAARKDLLIESYFQN